MSSGAEKENIIGRIRRIYLRIPAWIRALIDFPFRVILWFIGPFPKRKKGQTLSLWVYDWRHSPVPWILLVALGALLAGGFFWGGYELALYADILKGKEDIQKKLLTNAGLATLFLALLAAPLAWYIWMIRDRNRYVDVMNEKRRQLLEEFNKLREWAADRENPNLASVALLQMQDFLEGRDDLFPPEIAEEKEIFQRKAGDFYRIMLQHRSTWDFRPAPGTGEELAHSIRKEWEYSAVIQGVLEKILIRNGYLIGDLQGVDLRGFELKKANLDAVNLSNGNLSGVELSNSNLSNALFVEANLNRTCLGAATIMGGNFFKAILINSNFAGANLLNANFTGANLESANLEGAYLKGANLSVGKQYLLEYFTLSVAKIQYVRTNLSGANLFCANISGANLMGANLKGANLVLANLSGANLSKSFRICDLEDANLQGANLEGADLSGAKLAGTKINKRTRFPKDFNWKAAIEKGELILVESEEEDGDPEEE